MIRALIFDLDNCLASSREVGEDLLAPAFAAMRHANRGRLPEHTVEAAFADAWRHPLDGVAEKYGFPEDMLVTGWEQFRQVEVRHPMQGYGDLEVLWELPADRFLVTSGFRRLQESKIKALGLKKWFKAAYVDAIDEPDHLGKEGLFGMILRDEQLQPHEALVIGDNPESEIEAANRLGIPSVQILRPGVAKGDNATHYIESLAELKPLLRVATVG